MSVAMQIKGGMHSQIEKYWFIKDVNIIIKNNKSFYCKGTFHH